MGKAAEGNGGLGKEKAAPGIPKNRSRNVEGLCGRASRCISIRNGRGVWMQRKRHSRCTSTVQNHKEKKTSRYQEQDQQKVEAYQEQINDIPPGKIAYVDECGIDTYRYREYGYATCGQ